MACLAGMLRTKGTLGVAQNKPTSMPLTPNCTPWAATAKSHWATSWHPAAVATPCTRAITGTGKLWIDNIMRVHCANSFW